MKKKRFSTEQIAAVLHQAEQRVPVGELCRQVGFSEQSFYRWKKVCGGLQPSEGRHGVPDDLRPPDDHGLARPPGASSPPRRPPAGARGPGDLEPSLQHAAAAPGAAGARGIPAEGEDAVDLGVAVREGLRPEGRGWRGLARAEEEVVAEGDESLVRIADVGLRASQLTESFAKLVDYPDILKPLQRTLDIKALQGFFIYGYIRHNNIDRISPVVFVSCRVGVESTREFSEFIAYPGYGNCSFVTETAVGDQYLV